MYGNYFMDNKVRDDIFEFIERIYGVQFVQNIV